MSFNERAEFWGNREEGAFSGNSLVGHNKHAGIFFNAHVLEIGPGAGRQFKELSNLAREYEVADISWDVLSKPIYAGHLQWQIVDYNENWFGTFDVVTFWYVVHHVKFAEIESFFGFVARHLKTGGHAYFNVPADHHPNAVVDDGIGTTPHKLETLKKQIEGAGMKILDIEELAHDCVSILAVRR